MLRPSPSDETRRKLINRKGHLRDSEVSAEHCLDSRGKPRIRKALTHRIGGPSVDAPSAIFATRPEVAQVRLTQFSVHHLLASLSARRYRRSSRKRKNCTCRRRLR